MSLRELIVLGTASQVPTRHRNHNGYFLKWDAEGILFDPGEGTQRQMVRANVSATDITRVCVTHFHGDHCLGLPGVIQRISLDQVPHTIPIHFPRSGQVYFDRLRYASIYLDKANIDPRPGVEGVAHEGRDLKISSRRLDHPVETLGWRVEEPDGVTMLPDRLEALGIRGRTIGELARNGEVEVDGRTVRLEDVSIHRRGQRFALVMDTRMCAAAIDLARDVDMLVCESTFLASEAAEAREFGHLTATEAATIAREAGVGQLVLAHFSQRYPDAQAFVDEARAVFPNAVAARDGDRIPLPKRQNART